MIWEQKHSSLETGQKNASSFETGLVTMWVLTYITQLQKQIGNRSYKYNTFIYVPQTITNNASDLFDIQKLHM